MQCFMAMKSPLVLLEGLYIYYNLRTCYVLGVIYHGITKLEVYVIHEEREAFVGQGKR